MTARRVLLLCAVLAFAAAAPAQEAGPPDAGFGLLAGEGDDPVDIVAEGGMEANNQERWVLFHGGVTATQGPSVLVADTLRIRYDEKNQISRITAGGDVTITQEDLRAVCQTADYFAGPPRKVVLTGDPEVWQERDHLAGETIVLYPDTDEVNVKSAPGRKVRVTLHPKEGQSPFGEAPEPAGETPADEAD